MTVRIDPDGTLTTGEGITIPAALVPELRAFFASEVHATPTVLELADEIPRVTIGSGYYATSLDSDGAREIAEELLTTYDIRPKGAAPRTADNVWRSGFSDGWYAARAQPGIAAATHSPSFIPPGQVPA